MHDHTMTYSHHMNQHGLKVSVLFASWSWKWSTIIESCWNSTEPLAFKHSLLSATFSRNGCVRCWPLLFVDRGVHSRHPFLYSTWAPLHSMMQKMNKSYTSNSLFPLITLQLSSKCTRSTTNHGTESDVLCFVSPFSVNVFQCFARSSTLSCRLGSWSSNAWHKSCNLPLTIALVKIFGTGHVERAPSSRRLPVCFWKWNKDVAYTTNVHGHKYTWLEILEYE